MPMFDINTLGLAPIPPLSFFSKIHPFTAQWEGGFVNHPNDPGGATKHGVSLRWLSNEGLDLTGDGRVDIDDVRAVTPEIAARLFHAYFYAHLHLDDVPPLPAAVTYDAAVNCGCARAVILLQKACNERRGYKLEEDGVLGPRTRARLKELRNTQFDLAHSALLMRERFHRDLANRPPRAGANGQTVNYRPFLTGWLNRTSALWRHVVLLTRDGVF